MMKIGRSIGCHQKSCRSFFYKNFQFPLCSRCTGIVIGELVIAPILLIIGYNNLYLNLFLLIIMGIDGGLQYFDLLKSNNIRRFITGLGGGYALTSLTVWIIIKIIHLI
ncbi:MAG: DUF2085 domain-containing protein [Candidatus Izemoplasmatales bacterium]